MTHGRRRAVTYFANALQQRLSTALVWLGDAIAFLSRTAWPLVDLLIRIWIGKLALVLSVLISTDWAMAVSMAAGSYPIPVAGVGSTALLSQVYWLAACSLILGLATRVGAAVLLALTVASHIGVAALDLNLFWMALLAYYVLLGADRLSLDRLLSQGLKNSPLPRAGALITLLDAARPAMTGIYLLALRVALMFTLLLATAMMATTAEIHAWLPVSSATRLFGNEGVALALLIGSGLVTRATALLAVVMIGYHKMIGGDMSLPFYWTVLLLLLVAKGPGPFSLYGAVLPGLRRSLPELSGKPAFNLESRPPVSIVGAGFGGLARVRRTPLLRIGQLAEHVACGRSVESGSFLIDLDGKICSAKSNRSRHRDRKKGISDFVQKFVPHRHILPLARPNFSVVTLGRRIMKDALRRRSPSSAPRHFSRRRSNTVAGRTAAHWAGTERISSGVSVLPSVP